MQGAQVPFSLSLFGIPILRSEALPALGQSGDVLLVDLAAYAVAIGQEVTVDASSHYGFTSDSTFYRLTWLAQGKPMITAPITLLDGVTQVSPFVELSSTVAS
jgi:HK97 family phage major capsid protein